MAGQGTRCQSCVPHVTCIPSSRAHIWFSCSCPRLSPLVSICVLIAPHLFQFSSLLPSILKPWFSPCLMSGIKCLPCVIKALFAEILRVSSLLALPSESVTEYRTQTEVSGITPPSFLFSRFLKSFLFPVFPLLPR